LSASLYAIRLPPHLTDFAGLVLALATTKRAYVLDLKRVITVRRGRTCEQVGRVLRVHVATAGHNATPNAGVGIP
jgi:hypothetical protein